MIRTTIINGQGFPEDYLVAPGMPIPSSQFFAHARAMHDHLMQLPPLGMSVLTMLIGVELPPVDPG